VKKRNQDTVAFSELRVIRDLSMKIEDIISIKVKLSKEYGGPSYRDYF
jgi:hypothetical protein